MASSFDFPDPTHFTAGAIGEPGHRTFFLQVGSEIGHVTFKLEKQQVLALAQFFQGVLEDLPAGPVSESPTELLEPWEPEWVVGQIAVAIDEADAQIVLVVEELVPEGDEDEDDDEPLFPVDDDEGASLRVRLDPAQARQFVATAEALAAGSRPPCRWCGGPMDPGGHACPRMN